MREQFSQAMQGMHSNARKHITEPGKRLNTATLVRDRDRGKPHSSAPPTPPDMRVRIRRFGELSDRFHSQSRNPERVEVSIGQCDAERG